MVRRVAVDPATSGPPTGNGCGDPVSPRSAADLRGGESTRCNPAALPVLDTALPVVDAAAAEEPSAVGSGCGLGGQTLSDRLPGTRGGVLPVARYRAIVLSVQATPNREPACVVPSLPSTSEAVGKILRT